MKIHLIVGDHNFSMKFFLSFFLSFFPNYFHMKIERMDHQKIPKVFLRSATPELKNSKQDVVESLSIENDSLEKNLSKNQFVSSVRTTSPIPPLDMSHPGALSPLDLDRDFSDTEIPSASCPSDFYTPTGNKFNDQQLHLTDNSDTSETNQDRSNTYNRMRRKLNRDSQNRKERDGSDLSDTDQCKSLKSYGKHQKIILILI